MEMLLMGACLSLLGLAVTCIAFGAATREAEESTVTVPAVAKEAVAIAPAPARFFADPPLLPVAARTAIPIEALLLQLENHIRLEQAAAECFLEAPTASLLHSRTMSPLLN